MIKIHNSWQIDSKFAELCLKSMKLGTLPEAIKYRKTGGTVSFWRCYPWSLSKGKEVTYQHLKSQDPSCNHSKEDTSLGRSCPPSTPAPDVIGDLSPYKATTPASVTVPEPPLPKTCYGERCSQNLHKKLSA